MHWLAMNEYKVLENVTQMALTTRWNEDIIIGIDISIGSREYETSVIQEA